MDDPKIVNVMRFLFLVLERGNYVNVSSAANSLHITKRTVYRYIETLNDVGFDITTNPISICWDSRAFKQLRKISSKSFRKQQALYNDILKAIDGKLTTVFVNYTSGNSCKIENYSVEPYRISSDGQFVYCFDLNDGKCKTFKISRIGEVRLLDNTWTHAENHLDLKTDVFGISSIETFHVKLSLDLHAYCLLIEEFPVILNHPTCTMRHDGNRWILEIDVCGPQGIARFYMGLMDCIEIMEGQPMKEYVNNIISSVSFSFKES